MVYTVSVGDNSHYMDESERWELGQFATIDEAIDAARRIVDDFLLSTYRPGMSANGLFEAYKAFGEDPFVTGGPPGETRVLFSAWDYAERRCTELCVIAP